VNQLEFCSSEARIPSVKQGLLLLRGEMVVLLRVKPLCVAANEVRSTTNLNDATALSYKETTTKPQLYTIRTSE
jgi:hypothetical protein